MAAMPRRTVTVKDLSSEGKTVKDAGRASDVNIDRHQMAALVRVINKSTTSNYLKHEVLAHYFVLQRKFLCERFSSNKLLFNRKLWQIPGCR